MIKHIVMFQLKESNSEKEKLDKAIRIKNMLDSLPEKINEIEFLEVGINTAESPRALDMVLISHFKSYENLSKYRVHPEHVKALELIKKLTIKAFVVDYEI